MGASRHPGGPLVGEKRRVQGTACRAGEQFAACLTHRRQQMRSKAGRFEGQWLFRVYAEGAASSCWKACVY
jgi:hypothetical protein